MRAQAYRRVAAFEPAGQPPADGGGLLVEHAAFCQQCHTRATPGQHMPGSVPLTQPGNQRGLLLQSVFKAGDGAVDQTGHNQQLARLHQEGRRGQRRRPGPHPPGRREGWCRCGRPTPWPYPRRRPRTRRRWRARWTSGTTACSTSHAWMRACSRLSCAPSTPRPSSSASTASSIGSAGRATSTG